MSNATFPYGGLSETRYRPDVDHVGTKLGRVRPPFAMTGRSTVLLVDGLAGWCVGNCVAVVLVTLHPVPMSALLAARNVAVGGLFVGGVVTLLLTGARDYRRLRRDGGRR